MTPPADGAGDDDRREGRDSVEGIEASLKELGASGRATWNAGRDAGKAFRILLSADVSLARSAFGRTLAFTGVAIAFGASAWLLLMAALIAGLSLGLGWPWALSLLLTGVLSVAAAAGATGRRRARGLHARRRLRRVHPGSRRAGRGRGGCRQRPVAEKRTRRAGHAAMNTIPATGSRP